MCYTGKLDTKYEHEQVKVVWDNIHLTSNDSASHNIGIITNLEVLNVVIDFSGGLCTVAPKQLASHDNQPSPSTPGQIPRISRGFCVSLNITAPGISLTDQTRCIFL